MECNLKKDKDMTSTNTSECFKEGEQWYHEKISDGLFHSMKIEKLHYTGKSKFQEIQVLESTQYGQLLSTDGLL
jgi:spermidine synthase